MAEGSEALLDWMVYWWMAPVSVVVATAAMSFGIGGAVLFSPVFVVVFPLAGVPTLTPATAFGAALMTELVGFTSGLVGYQRKGLVHWDSVKRIVWFSVPLAVVSTFGKRLIPPWILILSFAAGMFALAIYMAIYIRTAHPPPPSTQQGGEAGGQLQQGGQEEQEQQGGEEEGKTKEEVLSAPVAEGLRSGLSYSLMAVGAFMTGLISVGIGETCVTSLQSMWKLPMRVAAGTSVAVVMITVLSAAVAEVVAVGVEEVPWNLVCYTMPGVLVGGQIGVRVSSRIDEATAEHVLLWFFVVLGVLMSVVASTMMF